MEASQPLDEFEQAQLKALEHAADLGWTDIAAGTFVELSSDELEGFIEQLGRRAPDRVKAARAP